MIESNKLYDHGKYLLSILKHVVELELNDLNDLTPVATTMRAVHKIINDIRVLELPYHIDTIIRDYNYFCFHEYLNSYSMMLVLHDNAQLRQLADECGVSEFVYFGTNSDPIIKCTEIEFVQKMMGQKLYMSKTVLK